MPKPYCFDANALTQMIQIDLLRALCDSIGIYCPHVNLTNRVVFWTMNSISTSLEEINVAEVMVGKNPIEHYICHELFVR